MHWFFLPTSLYFLPMHFKLSTSFFISHSLSLLTLFPSPFPSSSPLIFSLLTFFSFSFWLLSLPSVCLLRIVGTLFAWHWPQDTSASGSISPSALALMGSPRGPCKEAPCSPHNPPSIAGRRRACKAAWVSEFRNKEISISFPALRGRAVWDFSRQDQPALIRPCSKKMRTDSQEGPQLIATDAPNEGCSDACCAVSVMDSEKSVSHKIETVNDSAVLMSTSTLQASIITLSFSHLSYWNI